MGKVILGVSIDLRSDAATEVQNILTKHGCIIRTRIGLHQQDGIPNLTTKEHGKH